MKKIIWATVFVVILFVVGGAVYRSATPPQTVILYFFQDGQLSKVERQVSSRQERPLLTIKELLKGPNKAEREKGYFTQIPRNVHFRRLGREDGILQVDLSRELGKYGGGTTRVQGIVAQIVYTLTELPGVKKVSILVEGESQVTLGGEGYVIDHPLTRREVSF